ncbi:MAG: peptidylprolyl isomerase [Pseudomonadota bacterium]
MQITQNKVVSIDYTLTNDAGEVLDTSSGREPLQYIQGLKNIIGGLEEALEGKTVGDKLDVTVAPADAYGEWNEALTQEVPKDTFSGVDPTTLEVGMQFQAQTPQGARVVTIAKISEDSVTVDANHPLAGMALTFAVEIMEVRDATEEELSHGHVNGEGGQEDH